MDLIIPAYNNIDITFRLLASLRMFAPSDTHVILVDNGSKDDTPTLKPAVESMGGRYLRLDPNRGPYGAVNAGIAHAKSDKVGVICNDVVVFPQTLQILNDVVAPSRPYVGATGVVAARYDYYEILAWAAAYGILSSTANYPNFHFSCFLAHRSLFDRVGAFDERFGLTYGDTDHEQRCLDAGITPIQMAGALIYHGHGTGRKRGGIDADVAQDMADYDRFVEKWKDRPDVLAKYPRESAEQKKRYLETIGWQRGER